MSGSESGEYRASHERRVRRECKERGHAWWPLVLRPREVFACACGGEDTVLEVSLHCERCHQVSPLKRELEESAPHDEECDRLPARAAWGVVRDGNARKVVHRPARGGGV